MRNDFISTEPLRRQAGESLSSSPLGQRIGLSSEAAAKYLAASCSLWRIIEWAAGGKPRPHVRVINLSGNKIHDAGYWLDPKSAGLPPYASFEILNVQPHDTSSRFARGPYANWIENYSKPRLRNVSKAEAIAQINRADVTLLYDPSLLHPLEDREWLSQLRDRQLVTFFPPEALQADPIVELINAGARIEEQIFLLPHEGRDRAVPFFAISGCSDPLDPPIPIPGPSHHARADRSISIDAPPLGDTDLLATLIGPRHLVDETGAIHTADDNTPDRIEFSLGPSVPILPRSIRFAHAYLAGTLANELTIRGLPLVVPPLRTSVTQGEVAQARVSILRNRRIDIASLPRDDQGRTLLSQAVLNHFSPDFIASLLAYGFDPDEPDDHGWTATAYAAALDLDDVVNELVWNGLADLRLVISHDVRLEDIIEAYRIELVDPDGLYDAPPAFDDEHEICVPSKAAAAVDEDPSSAQDHEVSKGLQESIAPADEASPPPSFTVTPPALPSSPYLRAPLQDDAPRTSVIRTPLSDSLSAIIKQEAFSDASASALASLPSTSRTDPISEEQLAGLLPSPKTDPRLEALIADLPAEAPKPARQLTEVVPIYASVVDIPRSVEPTDIRAAIHAWIANTGAELKALDPVLPRFDSSRFAVLSDEDPDTGLFALRFDNHVPGGLTYRTEFVVFPTPSTTLVSTRLQAIRPPGNEDDVEPSVPRIVAAFAELGARHLNLPVGKVLPVESEADADQLASIIFDPHRLLPLLAIYGPTDKLLRDLPPQIRAALLVVQVAPSANAQVQRRIGRDFIGYRGAWRIYPPGLKPDSPRYDAPLILDPSTIPLGRLGTQFRHTIWRLSRALTEDDAPTYLAARQTILKRQKDAQALVDARQAEAQAIEAPVELLAETDLAPSAIADAEPFIESAETVEAPLTPAPPLPDAADLKAIEAQIATFLATISELQAKIDQSARQQRSELQAALEDIQIWKHLAEESDAKVNGLIAERDEAKRENYDLRAQIAALTGAVRVDEPTRTTREFPTSFDALDEWIESQYEGRILLTKKALKAARAVRSEPHIVRAAFEALDILANEYLDAKSGDAEARERLLARQEATQLDITKVGEAINNHRYADEYFATVGNTRFRLDMHVRERGGTDFHPERHLRIYFAHDIKNDRIVIGHLPNHLTSGHS